MINDQHHIATSLRDARYGGSETLRVLSATKKIHKTLHRASSVLHFMDFLVVLIIK